MKPSPAPSARVLAPIALLAALLVPLAGCGGSDPGAKQSSPAPSAAASSTQPPATSSTTPSTTPSTPSTLPAGATLRQRLLPVPALPPAGSAWAVAKSDQSARVGACNDIGMDSIGASRTVRRDFAAGAAHAVNVVARVPDAMTAHRALKVLEAAPKGCPAHPGPLVGVQIEGATAWWYRTGTGKSASAFGVAVVGNRFSLVALDHVGSAVVSARMPTLVATAAARIR